MYYNKTSVNKLKQMGVKETQIFSGEFSSCLYFLFKNIERFGYNSGIYGWNYDIFKIDDFYFVCGDRYPSISQHLDHDKLRLLNKKFEKQQDRLDKKFYEDKIIKHDYTYRRLFNNLIEKQKQYFIKHLSKLF